MWINSSVPPSQWFSSVPHHRDGGSLGGKIGRKIKGCPWQKKSLGSGGKSSVSGFLQESIACDLGNPQEGLISYGFFLCDWTNVPSHLAPKLGCALPSSHLISLMSRSWNYLAGSIFRVAFAHEPMCFRFLLVFLYLFLAVQTCYHLHDHVWAFIYCCFQVGQYWRNLLQSPYVDISFQFLGVNSRNLMLSPLVEKKVVVLFWIRRVSVLCMRVNVSLYAKSVGFETIINLIPNCLPQTKLS